MTPRCPFICPNYEEEEEEDNSLSPEYLPERASRLSYELSTGPSETYTDTGCSASYCSCSCYPARMVSMRARNSAIVKGLGRKYCMPASCASRLVSASLLALIPMMIKLSDSSVELLDRRRELSLALSLRVASMPSNGVGHIQAVRAVGSKTWGCNVM